MIDDPRFPIGNFQFNPDITPATRRQACAVIGEAPAALRAAVRGLDESQVDTPYRDGGWTVRQVVHHVAESHMNAFTRFKLALTEDNPTVTAYDEDAWAKLPDVARTPVETSLALLDALHARWITLLESMAPDDFSRPLMHPKNGAMSLDRLLQLYAWHGRHHVAHVTALRARKGW